MRFPRSFVLAAAFAGAACLVLPETRSRADEPAPQPGQLRGVLAALKQNGKDQARQGAEWLLKREYVGHLLFVGTDPRGGASGGGWYRPSESRYDWEWLRQRCDRNGDKAVSLEEFGGPREWFEALDKDRDGTLTKDDFDWSSDSALSRATTRAKALFGRIDRDSNGQVSPEEWKLWFDALGGGKGFISQDDLIPLFMEKERAGGKGTSVPPAGSSMSKMKLAVAASYLSGDIGSPSEGPAVGEKAPAFSLRSVDGKNRISFSSQDRREKPLVLIFGSFT